MRYTDPTTRAAAQQALHALRTVLESYQMIRTHARIHLDAEKEQWADDSIAKAKADIDRLERDLGERS